MPISAPRTIRILSGNFWGGRYPMRIKMIPPPIEMGRLCGDRALASRRAERGWASGEQRDRVEERGRTNAQRS